MLEKHTILLVDDEMSIRETMKIFLEDRGYKVLTASNGFEALDYIKEYMIDILITDLRMPKMDGIELMKKAFEVDSNIEVIFISAYTDIKKAVEAIKLGAYDYITKSFTVDELVHIIEKALERRKLIEENNNLKRQLEGNYDFEGVIGKSEQMQSIFSLVNRIANSKATVLLTGESGVGKDVIAKLIFKKSQRYNKNFVAINCGAIPENLIESELFGHEKGAFTGAITRKIGKFELANEGTLFLDEVGELPLSMQVKFLRVLQEKQFERIGSLESIKVDFRIIAATNKDLYEEVKKGNFREDLYYRLNVVNIKIPPLRERIEDIPLLAERFLNEFSKEYNKNLKFIDIEVLNVLTDYEWKGNVRELRNVMERAVVVAGVNEEILTVKHLPEEIVGSYNQEREKVVMTLKDYERLIIMNTLKKFKGNKTKAAESLGIKRQTLYNKLKEYEKMQ